MRHGRRLLGGGRTFAAVKAASFHVAENEFVALVGESGSGKSTIAKMLVGLEQPSAGRILLNGEDLTAPSARTRALRTMSVQMVFQDPQSALNPRRRLARIITQAMEAGSRHASWDERLERTRVLLAEVGLPADFATRLPGQLSGGQRQRVNIAPRALQHSEAAGRRRDRFRARRVDPGAAFEPAGAAAVRARLRHAVHLA